MGSSTAFPPTSKAESFTLTGFVTGADNLERQPAIKVAFETTMPVHNLKFYTSKDLLAKVDADIPREGALAKSNASLRMSIRGKVTAFWA